MKQKRKLIPAIAMLMVAAVTLTSASYAWFTMSRQVTADGIQLTATAPTNLLISSETSWGSNGGSGFEGIQTFAPKTTIRLNDGKAENATPVGKLMPVSSIDGQAFFYPDSISEDNNGAPTATTKWKKLTNNIAADKAGIADGASKDGYYIDIPLWLKTEGNTAVNVSIDVVKTKIIDRTSGGSAGNILKSARLAILTDEFKTPAISNADKNMFKPTGAAYGTPIVGPIENPEEENGWHGVADKNMAVGDKVLAAVTVDSKDAPVKIYVRVWIEGQDAACVYANRNNAFEVQLVLKDLEFDKVTTTEPT